MDLAVRTATWSRKALPYDAEVEWIGNRSYSSGTRIDTGWHVSEYDEFFVKFSVNTFSGWITVFNVSNIDTVDEMVSVRMRLKNQINLVFCSQPINHNITDLKGINTVIMSFDKVSVNNVDYQFSRSSYTIPRDAISLFCQVLNGTIHGSRYFNGNLYSFSIKRNGKLAIEMIPVRFTNENGVSEGAMYDRVSGQLFRNAGTGTFIIGPDKASSVDKEVGA